MRRRVGLTRDGRFRDSIIKTIAIADGEILEGDIRAPKVEGRHTPVVFMITAPRISCERESENRFSFILPLQHNIVLFDKDLLAIDPTADQDMPGRRGVDG